MTQPFHTSLEALERLKSVILPRTLGLFKPPAKMTISQWADQKRQLSPEVSAESGQWDTSKAEYQREIMDVITEPQIEEVTVMKSVRSGGTQAAVDNPIGYFIDQDPGPMLVVMPTKPDGRIWSKDHFDTMVRDTECLRGKVHSEKIKDRKNEILHKTFPGGMLYIIGSNSLSGFEQKTIQRAFLDDVDMYDPASGIGDQIELARNRTLTYTYHHRKIIKVSRPTIRGISRIRQEFAASDQRHHYPKCPFCGYHQVLLFSREHSEFAELSRSELKFDTANLSWVYYECENCHKQITEKYKNQIVREGKWIPQKPQVTNHAGFHFSEMISPFSSWHNLAKDFLSSKQYREKLRVFINQRLAETFEEEKSLEINEDDLINRVEHYAADVPAACLFLTAGVDVQLDRLEVIILGWTKDWQSYIIERRIIFGSPDRKKTWDDLDEYIFGSSWRHESGLKVKAWTTHGIVCMMVDSGFSAENVYRYVKRYQRRYKIFATKGDEGFKKPFIVSQGYDKKFHARFAMLGVDSIKVRVYDRLNIKREKDKPVPAGYVHFKEGLCNQEFFDQLTAERHAFIRNRKTGFIQRKWVMREGRDRNEVLDCYVLNFAAVTIFNPDMEKYAKSLEERTAQLKSSRETKKEAPGERPQNKPNRHRRRRRNFAMDI